MNNFLSKLSHSLLFILLSFYTLNGQEYIFDAKLYTTDDGLANLMTRAVVQDHNGMLWIGTEYGLNRYDGYSFQLFTKEQNGLFSNEDIYRIKEDGNGNLWITYVSGHEILGIDIFNPQTQQAISLDTFFTNDLPFKITELYYFPYNDAKNRMWFGTKDGRFFVYQNGSFQQRLTTSQIDVLTIDEEENMWVAKGKKLWFHTEKAQIDTIVSFPYLINDISITKEECWVTTWRVLQEKGGNDLWSFNKKSKEYQPFLFKKGQQEVTPRYMKRTSTGFWYTVLDNRTQLFNAQGHWLFDFNSLLPEKMNTGFNKLFENKEYIWLPLSIGLLKTKIQQKPFQLIHRDDALSDCRTITEDEEGNIYFLNKFLYRWNPQQQKAQKVHSHHINTGLIYTDTMIWAGLYNGQILGLQLDLRTKKLTYFFKENNRTGVLTSFKTTMPNRFLAGTEAGLIYLDFDLKKYLDFDKYNEFEVLKSAAIYHFYQNEDGIWLATSKGVFLMDEAKGVLEHFHKASGELPFDYIRHIYEDEDGVFWLATKGGGIIKWEFDLDAPQTSTTQQITTAEGLSDDYTYAIYGDDFGKLWIPSDKGLMCLDKQNLNVLTYLVEDGLPHNEFNSTSHYKAKDGTLYFGGLGGIIRFHPKDFANSQVNNTPLSFIGYSVLEGDATVITDKSDLIQYTKEITIQPTDKFARLDFSLLDFDDPAQHTYAYKIEGYSEQWNYINENYVPINSLPYGNYQLRVKGRNISKGWSNQELSLNIIVKKPFYLKTWFLVLMGLFIVAAIFAIIKRRLYTLQRDRERLETEVKRRTKTILEQTEQLKALDKTKTRFFSNITHEFRTPLTLVIGPLEQVLEMNLPLKSKTKLGSVLNNAKHLLGLINQLLDLSKLESGQMKIEVVHGDIIAYTKELMERIKPLADKKQHSFKFIPFQAVWKTHFDQKKWDKIIYNLVSNAIKYTPVGGKIEVTLKTTNRNNKTCLYLTVKDSGIGIKENQLDQIFNRFYQVDDSATRHQDGTGIGLALVKELVELQKGSITVTSEWKEGTSFEVNIPVYETVNLAEKVKISSLELQQLPDLLVAENRDTSTFESNLMETEELLKILIIEDNTELRLYIRDCIDVKKYVVLEAINGREGIEKALTFVPDLIISDVMMPEKDGFEVTKTLRSTVATSHIPIILLTAKAALESRLEGIRSGADVYLTKPFSPKELHIRIEKLIEIRQLIRQSVNHTPTNSIDPLYEKENLFLQEIRWIIINNMENNSLNGAFIGQQLGMSRMQVHRKMKALINLSAGDMIRDMRLEKALELLLARNNNISEIAYQIGFNTPAYFSKIFKEKFGKTPSEVLKEEVVVKGNN